MEIEDVIFTIKGNHIGLRDCIKNNTIKNVMHRIRALKIPNRDCMTRQQNQKSS